MIWQILRVWITFIIPGFYRRLQIKNADLAKVKGPVIIAMNHPNSFTDPIVFAILTHPLRPRFLARGDAFKPGLATWFLEKIGIIPIFRIQDGGKEGLKKNEDAYRRVNEFLKQDAKVIIFAEGLCVQERRLRPLKKGVPRMVFGAYECLQTDDLIVLPVGLNYSQPDHFQSDVFINVGEPIPVRDFWDAYQTAPAKTLNQFIQVLEPRMKALITHIDSPANDKAMIWLETLTKAEKMAKKGYSRENLEQDFEVLHELTAILNAAAAKHSPDLDAFKSKAPAYFSGLKQAGLRDWLFDSVRQKENNTPQFILRAMISVIGLPVFVLAILTNYLPFWLTPKLTWKIIKTKEFFTSIATGVAMLLFLVWYLILYFVLKAVLPIHYWTPFFLLVFGVCAAISIPYYRTLKKTIGGLRYRLKTAAVNGLKAQRAELLAHINKF